MTVGILCLFSFIFGAETRSGASPIRHGFLPSSPVETFLKTFAYILYSVCRVDLYSNFYPVKKKKKKRATFSLLHRAAIRSGFFFPPFTMENDETKFFSFLLLRCIYFLLQSCCFLWGGFWLLSTDDHVHFVQPSKHF